MSTTSAELFEVLARYIDERVSVAVERRKITPAGLRVAAGLTAEQLVAAVVGNGIKISANQLRRYEAGEVDNLRHKSVQVRMTAIAKVLGVSMQTYQDAIETVRK